MHDRVDAPQCVAERGWIGEVTERDLHAHALGTQPAGIAHQAAHLRPFGHERAQHGEPY